MDKGRSGLTFGKSVIVFDNLVANPKHSLLELGQVKAKNFHYNYTRN